MWLPETYLWPKISNRSATIIRYCRIDLRDYYGHQMDCWRHLLEFRGPVGTFEAFLGTSRTLCTGYFGPGLRPGTNPPRLTTFETHLGEV